MRKFLTFLAAFSAMKSMAVHPEFEADVYNFIQTHSNRSIDVQSAEFKRDLENLSAKFINKYSLEELREGIKYFADNPRPEGSEFSKIFFAISLEVLNIRSSKELLNAQRIVEILEKSTNCNLDWAKNVHNLSLFPTYVLEKITFNPEGKNYVFLNNKLQTLIATQKIEFAKRQLTNTTNIKLAQQLLDIILQQIKIIKSGIPPKDLQDFYRNSNFAYNISDFANSIFLLCKSQIQLLDRVFSERNVEEILRNKVLESTKMLVELDETVPSIGYQEVNILEKVKSIIGNNSQIEIETKKSFEKFLQKLENHKIINYCKYKIEEITETLEKYTAKMAQKEIINSNTDAELRVLTSFIASLTPQSLENPEIRRLHGKFSDLQNQFSELATKIPHHNLKIRESQSEIARLSGLIEKIYETVLKNKLQFAEEDYLKLQKQAKSINPSNPDKNFIQECTDFLVTIRMKIDLLQDKVDQIRQNIEYINAIIEKANFVPVSEGEKIQEEFRKQLESSQNQLDQILDTKSKLEALKSKVKIEEDSTGKPTTTTLYGPDQGPQGQDNSQPILVIDHRAIEARQAAIERNRVAQERLAREQREYLLLQEQLEQEQEQQLQFESLPR